MDDKPADTTSVTIRVGPPKFQTSIDFRARAALGIDDLDDGEKAILQADLKLKRVVKGGDSSE